MRGTRKRLDHIDAMRPVKQAGVVSTHTLLAFAPVAAGLAVGASLQLLHVTREAFLFVSACMLAYSVRDLPGIDHRTFWRRRFALVAVPYLCWTLIYFFVGLPGDAGTPRSDLVHLLYLFGTGYYQLYYLLVLLEFYALFPLLLVLLRKTAGHHGVVLLVSGACSWSSCPPCTGTWRRRGCRASGPPARSPRTSSISSPAWSSRCISTRSTSGSVRTCVSLSPARWPRPSWPRSGTTWPPITCCRGWVRAPTPSSRS